MSHSPCAKKPCFGEGPDPAKSPNEDYIHIRASSGWFDIPWREIFAHGELLRPAWRQ